MTYPGTADSNIENKIQGTVAQTVPNVLVVDPGTGDLVELLTIHEPCDSLIAPAALGPVKLDSPGMPALIWDSDSVANTGTFVTDTAGIDVAVHCSVTSELAVDCLHGVDLTTRRPATTVAEDVSKHPKGGPDTLLVVGGAGTEAYVGFGSGDFACLRSENILALDTTRSPAVLCRSIAPRHKLESVTTASLDVSGGRSVDLKLCIDIKVSCYDVPSAGVGQSAAGTSKGILPDFSETTVVGGIPGDSAEREERENEKGWLE